MQTKIELLVETHTKDNIYFAALNNEIPSLDLDDCPKQVAANLLKQITDYDINPYENSWIALELHDFYYRKEEKVAYIVFMCRIPGIPEKITLNTPYEWKQFSEISEKIERIKGLF